MYRSFYLVALLFGFLYFLSSCTSSQEADMLRLQAQKAQLEVEKLRIELALIKGQKPGMIHSVFVWLKADMPEADRAAFAKESRGLGAISSVQSIYVGTQAETAPRPIVDHSYDYAIIVNLADVAGHDAYQVDPIHKAYVEKYGKYFEKLQIYDHYTE